MVGLAARASLPCLGVPRYARVGADPLLVLCLLRKGLILQGWGAGAEEAQPQRIRDLPVPSPSTAAPKAGEVGRVTLDWDPNRGLPERGARPELSALR